MPLLLSQVVLLDPVQYPGALKVFAREVCKNDLLNFGRMHWWVGERAVGWVASGRGRWAVAESDGVP